MGKGLCQGLISQLKTNPFQKYLEKNESLRPFPCQTSDIFSSDWEMKRCH